jgi:hypothetical protein
MKLRALRISVSRRNLKSFMQMSASVAFAFLPLAIFCSPCKDIGFKNASSGNSCPHH